MNNNTPRIVFGPDKITMYSDNGIEICSISREPTVQVQNFTPVDFNDFIPPKEGNGKMRNEVLSLYERIKREQLEKEYEENVKTAYENLDVVKRYQEIVNLFNTSMEELANEYASFDTPSIVKTGYSNDFRYELNSYLMDEVRKNYKEEYQNKLLELRKLVDEVNAMLSLSGDKDYQIEVLDRYGITKKGKLNI